MGGKEGGLGTQLHGFHGRGDVPADQALCPGCLSHDAKHCHRRHGFLSRISSEIKLFSFLFFFLVLISFLFFSVPFLSIT